MSKRPMRLFSVGKNALSSRMTSSSQKEHNIRETPVLKKQR
jgi:hypothetical protein